MWKEQLLVQHVRGTKGLTFLHITMRPTGARAALLAAAGAAQTWGSTPTWGPRVLLPPTGAQMGSAVTTSSENFLIISRFSLPLALQSRDPP